MLATAGKADVAERSDIIVTADPVSGGARLQAWTPGPGFTETVPVFIFMAVLGGDRLAVLGGDRLAGLERVAERIGERID